ncbi:hypothetical protein ACOSQ2_019404 [Xanthoceras sorbifolium]
MSTRKRKVHEQRYGSSQRPWNYMGICYQSQLVPDVVGDLTMLNLGSTCNTSGIISGHFGSPSSIFSSTDENGMSFSQGHRDIDGLPTCSQVSRDHGSSVLPNQYSNDNLKELLDSAVNLQSAAKFQVRDNQNSSNFSEKQSSPGSSLILPLMQKSADEGTWNQRQTYVSFSHSQHQNLKVGYQPFSCQVLRPSSYHQPEKQQQPPSNICYGISSTHHNSVSAGSAAITNKVRIRWNQDLHSRFMQCVDFLGGADKATPKGILKLMDIDGLTICHVKSHLQKFRFARHIPESAEGKCRSKQSTTDMNAIARLDPKTGMQLVETLRLQLDVQKRLHEQLEVQRNLQLHIEEQGRQLKQMLDQQLKTDKYSLVDTHNLDVLTQDNSADHDLKDECVFKLEDLKDSHYSSNVIR